MKWLFRSAKDELVRTQRELIDSLRLQNEELKALFSKTSQFEVVEQTETGVTLKMKPMANGRGANAATGRSGFRSRVAAGEAKTVPVPNDSVRALEQRVAKAKLHQEIEKRVAAE